jgi:LysM repeat protein
MHVVREGETLGGIAERFGVPLSSLLNANGLTSRSVIRPGQSLRIPN